MQRFQGGGFKCLPELLGGFSDLCGEAAEKRGAAPGVVQHEQLSKAVGYVQRGGTVKRALEKVARSKVGLEGVLGAAQQAFPEEGDDVRVHPGMPANGPEPLLRPCTHTSLTARVIMLCLQPSPVLLMGASILLTRGLPPFPTRGCVWVMIRIVLLTLS